MSKISDNPIFSLSYLFFFIHANQNEVEASKNWFNLYAYHLTDAIIAQFLEIVKKRIP
ncbi:MAG: hypothetical protein ACTSRK_17770 [Promethearchaeota archaeon]